MFLIACVELSWLGCAVCEVTEWDYNDCSCMLQLMAEAKTGVHADYTMGIVQDQPEGPVHALVITLDNPLSPTCRPIVVCVSLTTRANGESAEGTYNRLATAFRKLTRGVCKDACCMYLSP